MFFCFCVYKVQFAKVMTLFHGMQLMFFNFTSYYYFFVGIILFKGKFPQCSVIKKLFKHYLWDIEILLKAQSSCMA